MSGTQVVLLEEMVEKVRAAVAARRDPDFVLIARTDARAVVIASSLLARCRRRRRARTAFRLPVRNTAASAAIAPSKSRRIRSAASGMVGPFVAGRGRGSCPAQPALDRSRRNTKLVRDLIDREPDGVVPDQDGPVGSWQWCEHRIAGDPVDGRRADAGSRSQAQQGCSARTSSAPAGCCQPNPTDRTHASEPS